MTCTGTGSCNQGRTECRDGCNKLHTDTRELVELALDGLLALALVGALIFTIFTALGFWSNK